MKVLVATEKPFAKAAVNGIREIVEKNGHELALPKIDAHAAQRGHGGVARGIGLDDITQ